MAVGAQRLEFSAKEAEEPEYKARADEGGGSYLRVQKRKMTALLQQALQEAAVVTKLLAVVTENHRRQLARVAHQDAVLNAEAQRDERAGLAALRSLVDDGHREAGGFQTRVSAAVQSRENDLRLFYDGTLQRLAR